MCALHEVESLLPIVSEPVGVEILMAKSRRSTHGFRGMGEGRFCYLGDLADSRSDDQDDQQDDQRG